MPAGGEDQARAFYTDVLGATEVEEPAPLRERGGVWFRLGDVEIHLGVEAPFAPAEKAHPAFETESLDAAVRHLAAMGIAYRRDVDLPTIRRVHFDDPFGNRIELLERRGDTGARQTA